MQNKVAARAERRIQGRATYNIGFGRLPLHGSQRTE